MVGLLVTGHGHFATGLGSALNLIAGSSENIVFVDFEGDSTEKLTENLNQALDGLKKCDGVLILADLAGGSPFNTAVQCKAARPDQTIEVMAGTNLPVLVEGFVIMESCQSPKELLDSLLSVGKESVVPFEQKDHEDNEEEDGI